MFIPPLPTGVLKHPIWNVIYVTQCFRPPKSNGLFLIPRLNYGKICRHNLPRASNKIKENNVIDEDNFKEIFTKNFNVIESVVYDI